MTSQSLIVDSDSPPTIPDLTSTTGTHTTGDEFENALEDQPGDELEDESKFEPKANDDEPPTITVHSRGGESVQR